MAGIMSKRQQARNERALQDLVQSVPGNNVCADCGARNPSWASWNLGIFLCMRCAALHRKLGTHISKVKSLSMDSWTNDQVESMKKVGNAASNRTYNPQSKRPPVPVDADEADSAMERFIRAKYVQSPSRTPTNGPTRQNTASSDEGTPPPLPPKTGTRFFKSGTLSFRSKKEPPSPQSTISPRDNHHLRNKPSKVFGASVHQDSVEATAQKLTQLRDMGFADDKRNAMILKGVNGNLEKSIEALIRLGEGGGGLSPGVLSPVDSLSRSLTPKPTKTVPNGLSNIGLSKPSPPLPVESPTSSNDPWEIQPPAQPQSSQSTGTLQNKNPFYNVTQTNPFGAPSRQQSEYDLRQSMQNMSLAASQQPLFPHHTGGAPATQPAVQSTYMQSMTPPVPQMHQNFASVAFNGNQTYPPPQPVQSPQSQGYNPFLQTPTTPQHPLSLNTSPHQFPGSLANNPFTRSPTGMASPMLQQIPEQSQQNVYSSTQTPYSANPFMNMGQPAQMSQPQQQPQQQQQWYQQYQQPAPVSQPNYAPQRANKESIMALYSYTPPAQASPQPQTQGNMNAFEVQGNSNPFDASPAVPTQPQVQAPFMQQQRPQSSTNNPFLSTMAAAPSPSPFAPTNQAASASARSRESMMLGMEMAWNNGRHSPDAFASLSARSG
ncbi:ArfGap-domain-containing protein [Astrocystis sublimbata]|nr:ArfGap-domain-containing protein [Astrocystis sublimbata]